MGAPSSLIGKRLQHNVRGRPVPAITSSYSGSRLTRYPTVFKATIGARVSVIGLFLSATWPNLLNKANQANTRISYAVFGIQAIDSRDRLGF